MSATIFTDGNFQGVDNNGLIVPLGNLYITSSTTGLDVVTYQDSLSTITNTAPITLSSSGKARVFLTSGIYNITLKDSIGATIWTLNNFKIDTVDTNIKVVDTVAILRTTVNTGSKIETLGLGTIGDGSGDIFYWDATNVSADNGINIIQVSGVAIGRWISINGNSTKTDSSGTIIANGSINNINYFPNTSTGIISIKISGLVTATSGKTDLGFMKVIITQDDRDLSSATNPPSYEFLIKANMASGVWYNTQAILSSNSNTSINVRYTRTAIDAYIEIGDIGATWNFVTLDVYHIALYTIAGYSPTITSSLQNSLLGTSATDSTILVSSFAPLNNPTFTNLTLPATASIPTPSAGDNSTNVINSAFLASSPQTARAWVNFNSVHLSGTYSQTGAAITVTMTNHGMTTGMIANLDFTSGTATDGIDFVITSTGVNTFTVVGKTSVTTSGNVTRNNYIYKSFGVNSIAYRGYGEYKINLNNLNNPYLVFTNSGVDVGGQICLALPDWSESLGVIVPRTSTEFIISFNNYSGGASYEQPNISILFF